MSCLHSALQCLPHGTSGFTGCTAALGELPAQHAGACAPLQLSKRGVMGAPGQARWHADSCDEDESCSSEEGPQVDVLSPSGAGRLPQHPAAGMHGGRGASSSMAARQGFGGVSSTSDAGLARGRCQGLGLPQEEAPCNGDAATDSQPGEERAFPVSAGVQALVQAAMEGGSLRARALLKAVRKLCRHEVRQPRLLQLHSRCIALFKSLVLHCQSLRRHCVAVALHRSISHQRSLVRDA